MLADIRDRLKTASPPFAAVEIAEDIEALQDRAGLVETGSIIVMPWREHAEPQVLATGGHRQRVEAQFMTAIVIRHYDDLMGGDRAVQFDTLKAAVEALLAGWQPDTADEPCELVGGESSPIEKGVSIYAQTWATARFLTGA